MGVMHHIAHLVILGDSGRIVRACDGAPPDLDIHLDVAHDTAELCRPCVEAARTDPDHERRTAAAIAAVKSAVIDIPAKEAL